jgi:murein DD-endopeptidase MepM/ murein hydrolase activator NlpD
MRALRPALGAILALLTVLLAQQPATAGGLVLSGSRGDGAGHQADVAALSPRSAPVSLGVVSAVTHSVQRGETLGAIAAANGTDVATLVRINGLSDPDRIGEGQVLRLLGSSGLAVVAMDGVAVRRVTVWPWPPVQGQTVVVWAQMRNAGTPKIQLEDRDLQVVGSGASSWALAPIGPLAAPGPRRLVLSSGQRHLVLTLPIGPGVFPTQNIPASASQPILSQPTRVNAETARMNDLFAGAEPGPFDPGQRFRLPLDGEYPHSSPFGQRRTYGAGTAVSAHAGEDFSAPSGVPVFAPAVGTVLLAEPLFVRGNAVVIAHGSGVYTGYWHLSELSVNAGEAVEQGQEIGRVGSTGLSTGAHLHWEMRVSGAAVDPMQWVD